VISQDFFVGAFHIPSLWGYDTVLVARPFYLREEVKGPELGNSGPALRGVGGGRGLTARDAVCIEIIVAI
jgi:hypothetical protein